MKSQSLWLIKKNKPKILPLDFTTKIPILTTIAEMRTFHGQDHNKVVKLGMNFSHIFMQIHLGMITDR